MKQHDEDLFSAFVRTHAPMLTTYLRTMIEDTAAVDDLFQETMIVAWRRFDGHDLNRPSGPWLREIARRLVWAHLRRAGRGPIYCDELVLRLVDEGIAALNRRPGERWGDEVVALDSCVQRLPEPLRRSVELFYRDGLNTEEIAAQMDCTREAIKKRLQRARCLLAACLHRKGVLQ